MIIAILIVMVIFLAFALLIAVAEGSGGYIGDSSMVPGILLLMGVVLTIIVVIGFMTGHVVVQ